MIGEVPRLIKVELIEESSINATTSVDNARVEMAMISKAGTCWMDWIIVFLAKDRVPDNEKEANRVCRMAARWVEAEALPNIRDVDVKKFVWKNIVTRFGVPNLLISDNGLQFDSRAFREFCSDLDIKNRYFTPAYPQSNDQAEATNKVIVNGLKKRLDGAKGR
nr:uncharacterized protein LOC111983217 [Quercus suber]